MEAELQFRLLGLQRSDVVLEVSGFVKAWNVLEYLQPDGTKYSDLQEAEMMCYIILTKLLLKRLNNATKKKNKKIKRSKCLVL